MSDTACPITTERSILTFNAHLRSNDERTHVEQCIQLDWQRVIATSEFGWLKPYAEKQPLLSDLFVSFPPSDTFQTSTTIHTFTAGMTSLNTYSHLLEPNESTRFHRSTDFIQSDWPSDQNSRARWLAVYLAVPSDALPQRAARHPIAHSGQTLDLIFIGSAIVHASPSPIPQRAFITADGDGVVALGEVVYRSNVCTGVCSGIHKDRSSAEDQPRPIKSLDHSQLRNFLIGHRGCGSLESKSTSDMHDDPMENTITAFETACMRGVSMVELDVQIPADGVPVIYHDFRVEIEHNRLRNIVPTALLTSNSLTPPSGATPSGFPGVFRRKIMNCLRACSHYRSFKRARQSIRSSLQRVPRVPLYAQALLMTSPAVGFNVEVKFPFFQSELDLLGLPVYSNLNDYVDSILAETHEHAGGRRIVFSSFSPEVCQLLRWKQAKYEVLLLIMEPNPSGEPHASIFSSMLFAIASGLQGIVCESTWISQSPEIISFAHAHGRIVWTYGNQNNDSRFVQHQISLGVDKIITDTI